MDDDGFDSELLPVLNPGCCKFCGEFFYERDLGSHQGKCAKNPNSPAGKNNSQQGHGGPHG